MDSLVISMILSSILFVCVGLFLSKRAAKKVELKNKERENEREKIRADNERWMKAINKIPSRSSQPKQSNRYRSSSQSLKEDDLSLESINNYDSDNSSSYASNSCSGSDSSSSNSSDSSSD